MIEDAQAKAREHIKDAADKYRKASDERYKALSDFNKEFGTYTTTYTGQQALEEYNRMTRHFNDIFDSIFRGLF